MKDGVEDFLVVANPRQLKDHKDDVIESLSRIVNDCIRTVSIREPTADPLDDSLLPLSNLGLIVVKLWDVFRSVVKIAESGCFAVEQVHCWSRYAQRNTARWRRCASRSSRWNRSHVLFVYFSSLGLFDLSDLLTRKSVFVLQSQQTKSQFSSFSMCRGSLSDLLQQLS